MNEKIPTVIKVQKRRQHDIPVNQIFPNKRKEFKNAEFEDLEVGEIDPSELSDEDYLNYLKSR